MAFEIFTKNCLLTRSSSRSAGNLIVVDPFLMPAGILPVVVFRNVGWDLSGAGGNLFDIVLASTHQTTKPFLISAGTYAH